MTAHRPIPATGAPPAQTQQPAQPPAGKSDVDEFQANSPSRHERTFETIYNGVGTLGALTDIAAKTGQVLSLAGPLAGFQAGPLAGSAALVAGTFDIARGASAAKQAAVNRDGLGSLAGSLQVVQGLATYAAALAPAFGGPAVASAVAAGVAVAAWAGRKGVAAYAKAQAARAGEEKEASSPSSSQAAAPSNPSVPGSTPQPLALASTPSGSTGLATADIQEADRSRKFEQSFAFVNSVDQFFRGIGGIASFWNVAGGVFSGSASGGLFGIPGLGFIGSGYTVATGVAMTKHSAINRNMDGTIDGALQTVGGLAAVATCLLGPAGMARIPAIVAAGAFVARTAYQIYSTSKRFGDGDDKEKKSLPLIAAQAVMDKANPFADSRGMEKAAL